MSDDHDDLLNFEIADGDFADGTLNEDELLLSDEDNDDFNDEQVQKSPPQQTIELESPPEPNPEIKEVFVPEEETENPVQKDESSSKVVSQKQVEANNLVKSQNQQDQQVPQSHVISPRQPFRQKFQRWPNQPPRWNPMAQQQQQPFQRQPGPVMRPPSHMMQRGPGPQQQMRPGFMPPNRPPFFNNNFMHQRPPLRPSMPRQRFFFQNSNPGCDPGPLQGSPNYIPAPVPALPRKVHINPNFKGGVEAAKNQLLKDQFFSSSSILPEDELLRKQQEFINHNMRQIEKRRHERTPSPGYRRGYSHSPSPPRYRRKPFRNFDRRRDSGGNDGKGKDENQPEEDEETRAYRQQIESQRKKREEIVRQKEMRRRQQAEKAKEIPPSEPLQPIVVTDKKIVLKRKSPEKSTTPPIKDAPITPTRRIVLKPKEGKGLMEAVKPSLGDGSKRKIQKILNS